MPEAIPDNTNLKQALIHLGAAERIHSNMRSEEYDYLPEEIKEGLRRLGSSVSASIGRLEMLMRLRTRKTLETSAPTPEAQIINENHPEIQKIYRVIKHLLDRIEQKNSTISNSLEKTIDKLVRRLLAQKFPEESFDDLSLEEIVNRFFGRKFTQKQPETTSEAPEVETPEPASNSTGAPTDIQPDAPEISQIGQALRELRDQHPFVFQDKAVLLSASISDQRHYIREYSDTVEKKLDELITLCKTADTSEEIEIGEGLLRRKDVFEILRKGPEQTLFEVQHRLKDLLEGDIPLSTEVIGPLKDMVNLWPGSEHGTAVRGVVHDVDNLHILIEILQSNPNTRREGQEYGIFERNCKEFGRFLLMKVEKKFGEHMDSKMDAETNQEELEAIDKIIENGMEIFGKYMDAKSLEEIQEIEKNFRLSN